MTRTNFLNLLETMTAEELETFRANNADYADRTGENALAQFDRYVGLMGNTPEMVLRSSWRSTLTRSGPIVGMVT